MNIVGLDKDFKDIIPYADKKGLRPFASCDGVLKHHAPNNLPIDAYVAFLQSEEIAKLMAVFLSDAETFTLNIGTENMKESQFLYGNEIKGNTFKVYFKNFKGENTQKFKDIIRGVLEHTIQIDEKNISLINDIIKALEVSQIDSDDELEKSDMCYDIELNGSYHSIFKKNNKERKINSINISTKYEYGYFRNMHKAAQVLSSKLGLPIALDDYSINDVHDEEFIQVFRNGVDLYVYLKDDKLLMLTQIIELVHSIEKELEIVEIPNQTSEELDEEYYDYIDIT